MNKQNLRDHQKWNVRTDLAYDEVINHQTDLPDLVQSDEKLYDIPIYKSVIGPNSSKIINKKVGTYYTIYL